MADYTLQASTTTNLKGTVDNYSVNLGYLDQTIEGDETYYDYPNSRKWLGYYKSIPELKKAVDGLAMWTTGKGWTTELSKFRTILENITGWGEDTFESIMWNMIVMKKVLGDSFAEIIRDKEGQIVNIKPLFTGDMRVVVDGQGIIKRYEHRLGNKVTTFEPSDILHLVNERCANEIHGTSIIEACQWVIDARNEAMDTERKTQKRNLALGILEVDSEDETEINAAKQKYQTAVNNGEVLVLPKGAAELKNSTVSKQNTLEWIRYLENFFYQALGIPKVILGGSEEFTEASSKIGYLTFEQVYSKEQRELESDLWNQIGLRITFNKPVSLKNEMLSSENKNTGQVGFQPKETTATMTRE